MLKRRIASRLQQRTKIRNEKLKMERIKEHESFLVQAKEWKKRVKTGKTSLREYELWLIQKDYEYKNK